MGGVDRVTVTLPHHLVKEIDRREKNRSKFIAEAVRNELDCRRRDELHRSLANPHRKDTILPKVLRPLCDRWGYPYRTPSGRVQSGNHRCAR